MPWVPQIRRSAEYYVDALPIVAMQLMFGLASRHVLVPIGVGLAFWMASVLSQSWKFNNLVPYPYSAIDYPSEPGTRVGRDFPLSLPVLSATVAATLFVAAYHFYRSRRHLV